MHRAQWNKDPILDFDKLASNWRIRMKDRRYHKNCKEFWPQCVSMDSLSREQLLEVQSARLQELVDHVVVHTPFYRQWASDTGYECGDQVSICDLPIVSKDDYTNDIEAFQSDAYPVSGMRKRRTSGSSGVPFNFRTDAFSGDLSYCCLWRALHRFGLRPGDRRVYLWGRSYSFNSSPLANAKVRAKLKLRNWLNVTLPIDAYDLTFENIEQGIDRIERFGPVYLHGYVSALYTIARALVDQGRTLKAPRLKVVVTESEKVYDFQREMMEKAFGCPILEHYGSVEFGNIAEPDPDGNMRINEDSFIVERESSGEAVITKLLSQAFPFIRYKLGDLIEFHDDIKPGLPYKSFESIVGRTVDMIPVLAGGAVHGVALAHLIDPHMNDVLKYQFHQIALDHFIVRIIPRTSLSETTVQTIEKDLKGLVGQDVRVEVVAVDHIEPAPSGKFRWVMSDVNMGSVAK